MRPKYRKEVLAARIAAKKAIVAQAKANPCTDCKNSYPSYVMDFDHVKGRKKTNISVLVQSAGWSISTLKKELAKCELVCANCHRIRTHGPPPR